MKSATIPPLRVTPELRQAAESVLQDGESLSSFVEKSLVKQVEFRRSQAAFIARGLAAREYCRLWTGTAICTTVWKSVAVSRHSSLSGPH